MKKIRTALEYFILICGLGYMYLFIDDNPSRGELVTIAIITIALSILFLANNIEDINIYNKIRKKGDVIPGVLISCKTPLFMYDGLNVLFRCIPVVSFNYNHGNFEVEVFGAFYRPPGKTGDNVDLIYWNMYPEKVIVADPEFYKTYKIHLGIWTITILVMITLAVFLLVQ